MAGYVISYHRKSGISEVHSFEGPDGHRAALAERLRLEKTNEDPDLEVVSLVGSSLEAIKRTHSRYFARN
ncbi:hypothetical protein [Demequina soli]|uniref:hypothetical protein n=1 Tax=Demequina soli TaxID=1638987 RepID=UPI000ACE31BB|nr:hypothetical protein [Demequina soli]